MGYDNDIYVISGGGGSDEWQRPVDWLPIPDIATGEEVIYILMAVYDVIGNFAAFKFRGDYTVDWGDGNIENVTSGVKAEHSYDWADVGDVTSEGFRQALIKITPQAGSNLTYVDLSHYHSSVTASQVTQLMDVVMNIPNVSGGTSLYIGVSIVHGNCRRVWIKEIGAITSMASQFRYFYSLKSVPLFDTPNVTTFLDTFNRTYGLQKDSIPLFDMTNATTISRMFENSSTLPAIKLDATGVITADRVFMYNTCLADVHITNMASVTNIVYIFWNCNSIQRCRLEGLTIGFDISNNQMSATALNEMFTLLGTANGAQSITITGNYGAATCDQTIATAKGYTIVN